MAKTVKITGVFEVQNAAQQIELRRSTNDTKDVAELNASLPMIVAGLTVNAPVSMGGVALAKRVYLNVSQEVTLKINNSLDSGFPFGPGDGRWCSTSGITGIFITTGPNQTEVEAIIAGD